MLRRAGASRVAPPYCRGTVVVWPTGVLDALRRRAGSCALRATRASDDCRLVLSLPAPPSDGTLERVRALLADLYGATGELPAAEADSSAEIMVKVPYELA